MGIDFVAPNQNHVLKELPLNLGGSCLRDSDSESSAVTTSTMSSFLTVISSY